jgi:hypothetical protein
MKKKSILLHKKKLKSRPTNKKKRSLSKRKRSKKQKSLRKNRKYDGMDNNAGGGSPPPGLDIETRLLNNINERLYNPDIYQILNINLLCSIIPDVMKGEKILLTVESEDLGYDDATTRDVVESFSEVTTDYNFFVCGKESFSIKLLDGHIAPQKYEHHKFLSFKVEEKDYVVIIDTKTDDRNPGDISAISMEE